MKIMRFFILLPFMFFLESISAQQLFIEQALFTNGTEGYVCFRIPAIIKADNGNLLAFAEGRKQNCGDFGNVDIVYKISKDHGASWSQLKLVVDQQELQAGNPGPVVVESSDGTSRIFLFYNTGIASEHETREGNGLREVMFITSDDHGFSWSKPTNITAQVNRPNRPDLNPNYAYKEDWRSYAVTPGHALQLKKGKYKGRILVPANHSAGQPLDQFDEYRAHAFYSDDGGQSFQLSDDVNIESSNEAIAVELSDGRVMMNVRHQSGRERERLVAISEDGGESWVESYFDSVLVSPVCQASILAYESDCEIDFILFSNPESQSKRERMTVKVSLDDGKTWPVKRLVRNGESAYSDLVQQGDGFIGLLYEQGNNGSIHYAQFNVDWLFGATTSSYALLDCR